MKKLLRNQLLTALFAALVGFAGAQSPPVARAPLVPCQEGVQMACSILAAEPADIVGVWLQYQIGPFFADPIGYIRYNADGTFVLADSVENTAAPYGAYPYGTYTLDGGVLSYTIEAEGVPAECRTALYELQVFRYGTQPVALAYSVIQDDCVPRRANLSLPNTWITH